MAALIDIARGDAGKEGLGAPVCAWCDSPIPMARRLAMPGCTLCVSCQEDKEHLKERG
ncbi:MAG: TraR/DksA family transcriptional regulator [Desulfobulbus sp.]|nr:MAG: TraR/DksA family transcriptional regulator [Desulfobulbus sp.]